MIHLILGGARSGKSAFAEQSVLDKCDNPVYIATATAIDAEMQARISHHQQLRADKWQLHECPLKLTELLMTAAQNSHSHYLLDCLTLWLNNLIFEYDNELRAADYHPTPEQYRQISRAIEQSLDAFIEQLQLFKSRRINITLVSNEIGLGIMPLGIISRLFVDHCGRLNQRVAQLADRVTLITAGIALDLKSPG